MVETKGLNQAPKTAIAREAIADKSQVKVPEINSVVNSELDSLDNTVLNTQENHNTDPKLHEVQTSVQNLETQESSTKKSNFLEDYFQNGPPWFQAFRNYFVAGLNTVGIGLNFTSVIASNSNMMPEPVAKYLDKAAEWYSRYVVSLGFSWNGVESVVGKRPFESLARFVPAVGFVTLPFYNFNLATGVSSAMSYLLDKVVKRNGNKQPGVGSAIENTKGVFKHSMDIFRDFFNSKSKESLLEKTGLLGLGLGSLGGLLFASQERDSFAARLFGNLRNFGGLAADYELVFNDDTTWRSKHKRLVGLTCSTASILNIIARWVDPKLGRILNHLSIAADDFGLTYWAQMSKKDNDEAAGKIINPATKKTNVDQVKSEELKDVNSLESLDETLVIDKTAKETTSSTKTQDPKQEDLSREMHLALGA